MAKVAHVTLDIPQPLPGADTAKATVSYALEFEPDEVGQPHRVRIELFAYDDPRTPVSRFPAPAPLYTFQFGSAQHPFLRRPWRTVTGEPVHKDTVTATVGRGLLDEDADTFFTDPVTGKKVTVKVPDEVYARVTVSREQAGTSDPVTLKA